MKFSALAASAALAISGVNANENDDFLTALASDYKSHSTEYFAYILTAKSYPSDLTKIAVAFATYTNNEFTTLLDSSQVEELRSYVTNFPFYSTRLEAEIEAAETGDSGDSTASETSAEASASETGSAASSSAASASSAASSAASSLTSARSSAASSAASSSSAAASSSGSSSAAGAGSAFVAPVGAILGAAALALL